MGEQPDTQRNENDKVREVSVSEPNYSKHEENDSKNVKKSIVDNGESCEALSKSIAPEQRQKQNDEIRATIKSVEF